MELDNPILILLYLDVISLKQLQLLRANLLAVTGLFSSTFLGAAAWQAKMIQSVTDSTVDMWEVKGFDTRLEPKATGKKEEKREAETGELAEGRRLLIDYVSAYLCLRGGLYEIGLQGFRLKQVGACNLQRPWRMHGRG